MYIFKIIKDLILKEKTQQLLKHNGNVFTNLNAVVTTEVFKTPQNNLKIVYNELGLTLTPSQS